MVKLEEIIFNQPIRKDIIHRVYQWSIMWNKYTTKKTHRPHMKKGSRKKVQRQKGLGKARQGFKYASGRHMGGKPHGHVQKDFRYFLPEKVILLGVMSMLSAKLEECIQIYPKEKVFQRIYLYDTLKND